MLKNVFIFPFLVAGLGVKLLSLYILNLCLHFSDRFVSILYFFLFNLISFSLLITFSFEVADDYNLLSSNYMPDFSHAL